MTVFVHLEALADRPFGKRIIFDTVPTAGDYPLIVDTADKLDWHWRAITTPDEMEAKRCFHNQYFMNRNELVVVDDFHDVVADAILISRDLNLCRQFCGAGGRALWIDYPHFRDASGSNAEWLSRVVSEAI